MPPWRYIGVFSWRTLILWSAIHFAAIVVDGSPVLSYRATLWAIALTVALLLADAERRRERRFLANLGVSRLAIIGVVIACFLSFEVAFKLSLEVWFDK